MQILPLVEMFCRWELQEDCSNLRTLMHRFDCEEELQSHELGRSLLCMLENDDVGFGDLYREAKHTVHADPFADLRHRLAAVGATIENLHPQVLGHPHFCDLTQTSFWVCGNSVQTICS